MDQENTSYKLTADKNDNTVYLWNHLKVYQHSWVHNPDVSVPENSTYEPPYDLSGTDKVNVWDKDKWTIVDIDPEIAYQIESYLVKIDQLTDSIYSEQIGSRQSEYDYAYKEALQWQEENFSGTAPEFIALTAISTGANPIDAAKEIIFIAQRWVTVMSLIRQNRLKAKTQIKSLMPYDDKLKIEQAKMFAEQYELFISSLKEAFK